MSDRFTLPPVPPTTPERARLIARRYLALANSLADDGEVYEADRAERRSRWWLAYATSLGGKEEGA